MAAPIQVEVTRGGVVEAVHTVHAVAVRDGQIVAEAGDPGLLIFLRSSAKPIQALPLVRARPDLDDARDRDRVRVAPRAPGAARGRPRAARGGAGRREPISRRAPSPIADRAQLLGKARRASSPSAARGATRRAGYRFAAHPLQQELLREVAAAAEVDPATVPVAIDGCGVPTFALRSTGARTRSPDCRASTAGRG